MQHADRSLCLLRYRRPRRADANTVSCAQSCTWQQTTTRIARSWSASRLAGRDTAQLDRGRSFRRRVSVAKAVVRASHAPSGQAPAPRVGGATHPGPTARFSRGKTQDPTPVPRDPGPPGVVWYCRAGFLTAVGNPKHGTQSEVTVYESADKDAVPAEQLSVRCALGPQAKRSPGGPGLGRPLHEEDRG